MLNISEVILSERIPLNLACVLKAYQLFFLRLNMVMKIDISGSSFNVTGFENGRTFWIILF